MTNSAFRCLGRGVLLFFGFVIATLALGTPAIAEAAAPQALINIDFDAGAVSQKTGPAATGQTAGDFWNLVSPEGSGTVSDLKYADNTSSGAEIRVANASGVWGNGVTNDLMYHGYIYPPYSGNIDIGNTNVPVGTYDIYIYGHGPIDTANSTYSLKVSGSSYGSLTTAAGPGWDTIVWQEGIQYVVFRGVQIASVADNVSLVVSPAATSTPLIAGMQLAQVSSNVVPVAPIIVSQPASQSVLAGSSVSFTVSAGGTTPFGFQWSFNGTDIAGATNSVLALTNVQVADAGSYSVTVTNIVGAVTSSNAVLTVTQPVAPSITTQPQDSFVAAGSNATLRVTATGTAPLTYQWRFNGTNIAGATQSAYTRVNAQPAHSGLYSVIVSNMAGSVLSSDATLTVTGAPPVIITQPVSRTVGLGAPVMLTVSASGSPVLMYQWKFNGSDIAGATRTILSLGANATNGGNYSVLVTNLYGSALSSNATLTVTSAPPVFGRQPRSWSGAAGATAFFTVSATGSGPLNYQWCFNGTNIAGATKTDLTITNVQVANVGTYFAKVSYLGGTVTSSNATLTLTNQPPFIYGQPQSQTVHAGTNVTFMVKAMGLPTLTYQWKFNGSNIVGATSSSLTITNVQPFNAGTYFATVSNSWGSRTSSNAVLTVIVGPPMIETQPVSQTVNAGANVNFSVTASGVTPLNYQWRFNGTNIAGGTGSSLALNNVQPENAGTYAVIVTNLYGDVVSSNALLTVNVPQPPGTVLKLINVDFDAGTASSKTGLAATGQTTNDFWNLYSRDDGQGGYRTFGSLSDLKFADGSSSGTLLTVANAPGAWGNGVLADLMYQGYLYPFDGGNISLTVSNLAAGTYEIYLYGHGNTDEQNSTYTLNVGGVTYGSQTTAQAGWNSAVWQEGVQYVVFRNVAITNAGAPVRVVVSPNASSYAIIAGMQMALVTAPVATPPAIVSQPQSKSVPPGSSVTFNVLASGTLPLSYQWTFGGNLIPGATAASLTLSNVQVANAGNYAVTVTNLLGSVTSSNAVLTVTNPPAVARLINVDFDVGTASAKTGPAATGQTAGDFWNLYSRDDGHGGYLSFGGLGNLKYADGALSLAGLTVANAPGAWGNGVADGMYQGYLYPFDGGNITINVTNLDAGTYDIYLYGHGPANDGNSTYALSVDGVSYGSLTTAKSGWNSVVWVEGVQYVVFRTVTIPNAASQVRVIVSPQASSYAVIAGMQIAQVSVPSPVAPLIVSHPASQSVMAGANVNFSVTAIGTPPLQYQWRLGGTNIIGATNKTLTLNNVQLANTGAYSVRVANSVGSVTSSNALLIVTPLNHAPVANSQGVALDENSSVSITLTGSDSDGDALSYALLSNPMHGSLSGTAPNLVYQVNTNYSGADGFTFRVNDGKVDSTVAVVSIVVRQAGSKPLINVDFDAGTASSKTGFAATGQTANDFWNLYSRDDGHGGYLTFGGMKNLKLADGSVTSVGLTVSNAPGAWGNGVLSDPMYQGYLYPFNGGNITINVTNLALGKYDIYLYGHGPSDDGNSTYQLTAAGVSYGSLTTAQAGWNSSVWQEGVQYVVFRNVAVTNIGQPLRVTVLPGVSGYAIIAGMQIASASAVTNPPPVNHAPVANDQSLFIAANSSANITLTGSDEDGNTLDYSLVSLPAHGTLAGIAPNLVYQPAAGYSGSDSFTFKVNDGTVDSAVGTVTIHVQEQGTGGLINVDFGGGTNTSKVGFAATGQTANDFWNFYSRDGQGGWLTLGTLSNLKFADGTDSGAGLTVVNAPGYWLNGSSDPMYNSYLYPLDRGNASVIATNLPVGSYEIYVYGLDGNYQLTVGADTYGSKGTTNAPIVNPIVWQEGVQYVVFHNVKITNSTQAATITVRPGESGYAIISGLQFLQTSTNVVVTPPSAPVAKIKASPTGTLPQSTSQFVISGNGSNAVVVLDGSLSTGPTNASLQFTWLAAETIFATNITTTNLVDLGVHDITLKVNDGSATGETSITLEVITPMDALAELIQAVSDSGLNSKVKRPLIRTLQLVYPQPDPAEGELDLNHLEHFQDKVAMDVAPIDPALAEKLINFSQLIIDAVNNQ